MYPYLFILLLVIFGAACFGIGMVTAKSVTNITHVHHGEKNRGEVR